MDKNFNIDEFVEKALEVTDFISLELFKIELQGYAQQREQLKLRWRVNKNVLKNETAVEAIEKNLEEVEAAIDEIKKAIKELCSESN